MGFVLFPLPSIVHFFRLFYLLKSLYCYTFTLFTFHLSNQISKVGPIIFSPYFRPYLNVVPVLSSFTGTLTAYPSNSSGLIILNRKCYLYSVFSW